MKRMHDLIKPFTGILANESEIARRLWTSQTSCEKLLLVRNDLNSGLGATIKTMSVLLLLSLKSGRAMLEAPSSYCKNPPHTMQCVYKPYSNCTTGSEVTCVQLRPNQVQAASARCVVVSLKAVHGSTLWYGTGNTSSAPPFPTL